MIGTFLCQILNPALSKRMRLETPRSEALCSYNCNKPMLEVVLVSFFGTNQAIWGKKPTSPKKLLTRLTPVVGLMKCVSPAAQDINEQYYYTEAPRPAQSRPCLPERTCSVRSLELVHNEDGEKRIALTESFGVHKGDTAALHHSHPENQQYTRRKARKTY